MFYRRRADVFDVLKYSDYLKSESAVAKLMMGIF
jgi:hypothetical protein